MVFGMVSQGENYKVSLLLSKLETEDLIEVVFYFLLCLFGVIVVVLFWVNNRLSLSVWRPYYKTLNKLKEFTLNQDKVPEFSHTTIAEFEQMNLVLTEMVNKAHHDYKNLKEFTENASHEIQTPLAIIKSKLESILQDQSLPVHSYQEMQSAFENVNRLSKLNEALLLLTKIENKQFTERTNVNLSLLVKNQTEQIEEMLEYKKIALSINCDLPFYVNMNAYLAEILINNLVSNALKHNVEGGQIVIRTTSKRLIMANTGKPLNTEPERLFQRFVKYNAGSDSTGLGLAIVAEIAGKSGLKIQYSYQNQNENYWHILTVESL
jgi:signal transduction histidine kinase